MNTTKHLPFLVFCALPLLFAGCGGDNRKIRESVKEELDKGFLAGRPIELTKASVNWKRTTSLGDAINANKVEGAGTFSATGKTTEGFYEPVGTDYGLRKLGITDTYESELNDALKRVDVLSKKYGTNVLGIYFSNERSEFPSFFETRVPKGEKVTLDGNIGLIKPGKDPWRVNVISNISLSFDEKVFTRESRLFSGRLDDPQTKETVNAIIKGWQDFVASVKSRLPEIEKELIEKGEERIKAEAKAREAAESALEAAKVAKENARFMLSRKEDADATAAIMVAKNAAENAAEVAKVPSLDSATKEAEKAAEALTVVQDIYNRYVEEERKYLKNLKEEFQKNCGPGKKYEGYYQRGQALGMVYVVFGEYTDSEQTEVRGTITFTLENKKLERPFTVTLVEIEEMTENLPVTGMMDNRSVPGGAHGDAFFNAFPEFKNLAGCGDFRKLIQNEIHITMRLKDGKMEFFISDTSGKTGRLLDMSEQIRPQPQGISGVWQRWHNGRPLGDFQVHYREGLYNMSPPSQKLLGIQIQLIRDVRYDGQTWSFHVQENAYRVSKFVLRKVNANMFERVMEDGKNEEWKRGSGASGVEKCQNLKCQDGFIPCDNPQCKNGKVRERCKAPGCVNGHIPQGDLEKQKKCSNCEGGWKLNDCSRCNGTTRRPCPDCNASGRR